MATERTRPVPIAEASERNERNVFAALYSIDVGPYVQRKGGRFGDYVPWATAWRLVKDFDPDARFEILENQEGLPYFATPFGLFVKVKVTVKEQTELDWYPVEESKPTARDIADTHQRALVKALGRLGFGLVLWEKDEGAKHEESAAQRPVTRERPASFGKATPPPKAKPQATTNTTPKVSEYVVDFGKFKGSKLSEIPTDQLMADIQYWEGLPNEPRGRAKVFLDAARAFMSASQFVSAGPVNTGRHPKDELPPVDSYEDIPF